MNMTFIKLSWDQFCNQMFIKKIKLVRNRINLITGVAV